MTHIQPLHLTMTCTLTMAFSWTMVWTLALTQGFSRDATEHMGFKQLVEGSREASYRLQHKQIDR